MEKAIRDVRALAIAALQAACVQSAQAQTARDKGDCEQVKDPGLKVTACSRILSGGNLSNEVRSFGHHHRGLGFLLQQNFDRAIVEFNEALRADPTNIRSLTAAAMRGATRASSATQSPTTMRRSNSIRTSPFPTTAVLPPSTTRAS